MGGEREKVEAVVFTEEMAGGLVEEGLAVEAEGGEVEEEEERTVEREGGKGERENRSK